MSSLARALPTARVRVADRPESKVSPMPVNAVANLAVSAQTRMSQARASEMPAPAQVPLMAATTGLGMPARARTTG